MDQFIRSIIIDRYDNGSSPKTFSKGDPKIYQDWARKKWKSDKQLKKEPFYDSFIEREYESNRESTQKDTQSYLNANWMHTPVLTRLLTFNLIDIEFLYFERKLFWQNRRRFYDWSLLGLWGLVGFKFFQSTKPILPLILWSIVCSIPYLIDKIRYLKDLPIIEKLRIIHEEVLAGAYNVQETIRRLHACEEKGINIQSITYSLLRLEH